MKSILLKNKRAARARIIVVCAAAALIALAAFVLIHTYTGVNIYPNKDKKHAMLRLEDVGPGGDYGSIEGLGKLRAVFDYIASERIPFHVAVIPRRMMLEEDGAWTERGIDDPDPDEVTAHFVDLLRNVQGSGGVLGMHGYTHQYGEAEREDGGHNSGTGNEFKVKDAPETNGASYAAARIMSSLKAFETAGLRPAFWESPHYHDTREQEKVFRSHVGILYQPDFFSLRSLKDLNMYDSVNTYGQDSLGSVYVPAPYSYVSDASSVDSILKKAEGDNGLAAMYVHPFKEFEYLEPVVGPDGEQEMKDGLPVYRYTDGGEPSHLHHLISGMKERGYEWQSLHDIVPFTPAHRVTLPPSTAAGDILLGSITGDGSDDVVVREQHRIRVIPGSYEWPRNRVQEASEVWLQESFAPEDKLVLADMNGDGKEDLVGYDPVSGALRAGLADDRRFLAMEPAGKLPPGLEQLLPFRFGQGLGFIAKQEKRILLIRAANKGGDEWVIAEAESGVTEDAVLYAGRFRDASRDDLLFRSETEGAAAILYQDGGGKLSAPVPVDVSWKSGELMVGDPNGDGLDDLILYNASKGVWRVEENNGEGRFVQLDNDYGPWAGEKGRTGFAADMDGNGKSDIASYDQTGNVLDLALSYRGSAR